MKILILIMLLILIAFVMGSGLLASFTTSMIRNDSTSLANSYIKQGGKRVAQSGNVERLTEYSIPLRLDGKSR